MKNLFDQETRCLIIQSGFSAFSYWNYVDVCKMVGARYPSAPLGLLTVAALLPQHWVFKLVDENIEPVLDEHFQWADLVCIGGMLPQQGRMLAHIERAHTFGLPVVAGGPDVTSQPELYCSADFRVLGEGEVTIPLLIDDLKRGHRDGIYQSGEKADMTRAAVPRFDLIRFRDYMQIGVQFSRGCPFQCEFCNITELFGRTPRLKTSAQMLLEFQTLYDLGYRGHVDIVDDNFIGSKKDVRKLLIEIREWSRRHRYPFYYSTECSINLVDDEPLMQLMKDVDFRYIFIGIETPEETALIMTKKTANVNRSVADTVRKINAYGMIVNAGFIIGFDHESDRIADNMIRCIQESGIAMAMLGMLFALPDTGLSRRLKKEGRLFENSSKFNFNNKSDVDTNQIMIDQTTNGLNFTTARPREDIFRDFRRVESTIYHPENYFERVTRTALQLKKKSRYRADLMKSLKTGSAFIKLSRRLLKKRTTAWPYGKMLMRVLFNNPRAIESAVSLSAMFIHFYKQSQFIVEHITREIETLEKREQMKIERAPEKRDYIQTETILESVHLK